MTGIYNCDVEYIQSILGTLKYCVMLKECCFYDSTGFT